MIAQLGALRYRGVAGKTPRMGTVSCGMMLVALSLGGLSSRAHAFSSSSRFAAPVSGLETGAWGGGGGRWFTGSPGDGYACAVCHGDREGPFTVEGIPEVFEPGMEYVFEIAWPEDENGAVALEMGHEFTITGTVKQFSRIAASGELQASAGAGGEGLAQILIPSEGNLLEFGFTLSEATDVRLTGSVSVEQMVFSESGRRAKPAADASRALLDLLTEKTADEVAFQTASVFYQTLQTRELLRTLDANLEKLSALQRMAQLQFTNGYATSTDVKRIRVAKTNLETQRTNLLAAVEALENTLKFLCGQPFEQPFVPTENLNAPAADSSKWQSLALDPANLTETRLLQKNMELNRTRYHALAGEKYPTVSAYATGLYQSQRADPNFFSGKTYWFGTAVIGVRARVKLFDGFRRKFKGAQLDFEWLKMQEDSRQLAEAKSLEFLQARTQFRIALQQLAVQQENVELAREIRDKLTLQYKEGVSPLSDLLSAQTAVSEAETNYWQQVFGYKLAALKLAKSAGHKIGE